MIIKGYKRISYADFQKELRKSYEASDRSKVSLAVDTGVDSTNTIGLAINSTQNQVVSDKVLTSLCTALGLPTFVMWINGERRYFIKAKNGQAKKN